MFYIIWEFQVNPNQITEFEEVYGSQGTWAKLFMKSKNYHGTTLIKDNANTNRYLTIDCWSAVSAFDQFVKQFSKEYDELDYLCEQMTLSEKKVGVFEKL